jgi:hypothetical protein
MPLRRRRPLLRAAAVGGGAYYMGKRRAEAQGQAEPAAGQGYGEPPPQPTTGAASGAAGTLNADAMQRLKELADLHAQGVLTDEEFAAQKARILA